MEEYISKFKDDARRVSLSESEKQILRSHIDSFKSKHPLPQMADGSSMPPHRPVKSPWLSILFPRYSRSFIFASLAIVFLLTTSLTAEAALPGETLYPIKTNVNDSIIKVLAIMGPEAKVYANIYLTKRRLDETIHLIAEGKARKDYIDDVQEKIKDYSEPILQYVNQDISKNDDPTSLLETVSEIKTVLSANEKILDAVDNTLTTLDSSEITELGDDLANYKIALDQKISEVSIKDKIDSLDPEEIKKEAENNLSDAEDALQDAIDQTAEDTDDGQKSSALENQYLEPIKTMIARSRSEFDSGNYTEAFVNSEQAEQISKEIILLDKSQKIFEEVLPDETN